MRPGKAFAARGPRLSVDQLLDQRWNSTSEAMDWLRTHGYKLEELGCIIGMAPDHGVALERSDLLTRPVLGSYASSYLDGGYATTLRGDLATNCKGDCMLRLPGPFSRERILQHAKYHAMVLRAVIEVVGLDGQVIERFDGAMLAAAANGHATPAKPAPKSVPAPKPAPEPAGGADSSASKPVRASKSTAGKPKAEPRQPPRQRRQSSSQPDGEPVPRTVSNDTMLTLARRAEGVSNYELTELNGGGSQPWRSYMGRLAAKQKLTLTSVSDDTRGTVHRLRPQRG